MMCTHACTCVVPFLTHDVQNDQVYRIISIPVPDDVYCFILHMLTPSLSMEFTLPSHLSSSSSCIASTLVGIPNFTETWWVSSGPSAKISRICAFFCACEDRLKFAAIFGFRLEAAIDDWGVESLLVSGMIFWPAHLHSDFFPWLSPASFLNSFFTLVPSIKLIGSIFWVVCGSVLISFG